MRSRMGIEKLKKKIRSKKAAVGVIGLGYVGLPLALTFAKKGFRVIGIDISESRIDKLRKKISYISDVSNAELKKAFKSGSFHVTTLLKAIKKLDAVIICVPTPLTKKRRPDMSYIRKAVTKVKNNIKKGQIVVLESTTYPGTTKEILLPILESTGLKEGKDFYLAFSPERIDPANRVYKTENTPKVIGGASVRSTGLANVLYGQVIERVVPVSSTGAAEMVKLLENTFRIVNTALVNELATLCNKLNLDIWDIIEAAKTKPYGFMPFYPGPGVGGHCIPVDPLYLSWKAKRHGFETKFIDLASSVNEAMPGYVVHRIENIFKKRKKKLKNAKILILGIAYKKGVRDLRESPALGIIRLLQAKKADLAYNDPYFPFLKIDGINLRRADLDRKSLRTFDAAVLVTDHANFDYKTIAANLKIIFDTRNAFEKANVRTGNIARL